MPPTIIVAAPLTPAALAEGQARFDVVYAPTADIETLWAEAARRRAMGVLISGRTRLTAEALAGMPPEVKVIATATAGFDHIDVAAAAAAGVVVTNTADAVTAATADLTLFLLLGACRRGKEHLALMAQGWRRGFGFNEMLGMDLAGRTLAIVGMGRIGQAVAHRARAFDMSIAYHNRRRLPAEQEGDAVYYETLQAMLPHAQVLCLTAPGGDRPLVGAAELALLPAGAVLINSGRGSLVDEDALITALTEGRLAAAGLDVFQSEPAYDLRLRDLPNVFATPHIGSATVETRTAMALRALGNIAQVAAGETPGDLITPN